MYIRIDMVKKMLILMFQNMIKNLVHLCNFIDIKKYISTIFFFHI